MLNENTQKDICTLIFIAALFLIPKIRVHQCRMDKEIVTDTSTYIHTLGYYSSVKKNVKLPFVKTLRPLC